MACLKFSLPNPNIPCCTCYNQIVLNRAIPISNSPSIRFVLSPFTMYTKITPFCHWLAIVKKQTSEIKTQAFFTVFLSLSTLLSVSEVAVVAKWLREGVCGKDRMGTRAANNKLQTPAPAQCASLSRAHEMFRHAPDGTCFCEVPVLQTQHLARPSVDAPFSGRYTSVKVPR